MRFEHIPGQDTAKQFLLNDFQSKKITHSYLLHGAQGAGKSQLAFALAQLLNCENPEKGNPCDVCSQCVKIKNMTHPDLFVIFPRTSKTDPKAVLDARRENIYSPFYTEISATIKIGQIKEIIREINLGINEGNYKIIIIVNSDKMNQEAANALLKSLEEPPPNVMFILTTDDAQHMLTTIKSRCRQIPLYPLSVEEISAYFSMKEIYIPIDLEIFGFLSNGSIGRAHQLLHLDLEFAIDFSKRVLKNLDSDSFADCYQITAEFEKLSDDIKEVVIDILVFFFKYHETRKNGESGFYRTLFNDIELDIEFGKVEQIVYFLDRFKFLIKRNFNLSLLFNNFLLNIGEIEKITELISY